jgi:hypothetical protein
MTQGEVTFPPLTESLRSFYRDRIAAIFRGDTPVPLGRSARLVIHTLPVSAFAPGTRRSLPWSDLQRYGAELCFKEVLRGRTNVDGYVMPQRSETQSMEYVQMFRTGVLERVHTGFTWEDVDGNAFVVGEDIVQIMRSGVSGMLATERALGIEPPIVVLVAVKGVRGRVLTYGDKAARSLQGSPGEGFDRDRFVLPEVICEDLDSPYDPLIEELLTVFWQAAGIEAPPEAARRR